MTQVAIVREVTAEKTVVEVRRRTACEGCHAEGCLSCGKTITAVAENPLQAKPGDRVEVEATTARVLFHACLVFVLPLLAAVFGYVIGAAFSFAEEICVLCALAGIGLTFAGVAFYTRVRGVQVPLRITRILEDENERNFD